MKKVLVVIGVAVLMAALAVPASAQFKTWGSMQIVGTYINKQDFNIGARPGLRVVTPQGPDSDLTFKSIWQRYNFFLQYGDPKTVRAVLGFEAESTDWGESADTVSSSTGIRGNNDFMGSANTDKASLGIKVAFIEFMVPNTPLQMTVGIQQFGYGGRLVESQDSMGISVAALFAPHKIRGLWYRRNDDPTYPNGTAGYTAGDYQGRLNYHVNDIYALTYNLDQKDFNVEAYAAYQNDLYNGYTTAVTGLDRYADHPWWVGANVAARPGNFILYGQVVYKGGERKYEGATAAHPDKVKYSAWALEAEGKYRIGPGMFAILEGYWSTGNDRNASDKNKMYTGIPGQEANSNFGLHRSVFLWMNWNEFSGHHCKNLDYGGFWYGRAAFEYSPTTWLNMILNYLYVGDTSKGNAGTAGINSGFGARTDADKSFHGHEINLITSVKIYEPLLWTVGLGAFIPGDVYDSPTKNAETAYVATTKLQYAF